MAGLLGLLACIACVLISASATRADDVHVCTVDRKVKSGWIVGESREDASRFRVLANARTCASSDGSEWHTARHSRGDGRMLPSTGFAIDVRACLANWTRAAPVELAVYAEAADGRLHHCDGLVATRGTAVELQGSQTHAANGKQRVGLYYEAWHAPIAQALVNVTNPLSIEQLIRSQKYTMADMRAQLHPAALGYDSFYYLSIPLPRPYCIYRKRSNETQGYVPDCDNITATLREHARLIIAAGFDHIVMDATNLYRPGAMQPPACPGMSCEGDLLQLRPSEVLMEEWALLRQQGIATPQVAIWQRLADPGSTSWWFVMQRLYNNATYQGLDMLLKDAYTGKYVMFVPSWPQSPDIINTLAKNNIVTVFMWANLSPAQFASGMWVFMSPCTANGTTSSTNVAGTVCNQYMTTHSPIGPTGTALTVGPSYQLGYSSLPFQAATKLGGLTLRSQFEKAFSKHPDFVLISSYNEMIAQPQANPFTHITPKARSMGLGWDPEGVDLWVDMYGSETRDLGPTVENGDFSWKLLLSCLRVYALNVPTCSVGMEACCQRNASAEYVNVWSLYLPSRDALLTTTKSERDELVGRGWTEICNPHRGPTLFCAYDSPNHDLYNKGPFLLFANNNQPGEVARLPIYRCYSGTYHFLSQSSDCHGATVESILGYSSTQPRGGTPRSLRLCRHGGGPYYHSLDWPCDDGDATVEMLGFAH